MEPETEAERRARILAELERSLAEGLPAANDAGWQYPPAPLRYAPPEPPISRGILALLGAVVVVVVIALGARVVEVLSRHDRTRTRQPDPSTGDDEEHALMSYRLLLAAAAMAALWARPAAAPLLCPDENGTYTPYACDLILPIEPDPQAVNCDSLAYIVWHSTGQGDNPVCVAYWEREQAADRRLVMMYWAEIEKWHEIERRERLP
jgi:hypothetical protein